MILDGTLNPGDEATLVEQPRVLGSWLIDEMKKVGSTLKTKSRLVAQNHSDEEGTIIATKETAEQRFSQHVALRFDKTRNRPSCYTPHFTQAYVQSRTPFERM